jgi:hypothetical protein
MNRSIIRGFVGAVFVAALVGCDKKETTSKEQDEAKPKQNVNIVTLTKENLESSQSKPSPRSREASS